MMDLLQKIDIFAIDFAFTTFTKQKFQTSLGGIMTIVTFSVYLALFIYFGQDLFNKTNPSIAFDSLNLGQYPYVNVNTSTFPIAWRFENENKQPVNLDGYVYIKWEMVMTLKNQTTGIFSPVNNFYFNTTPCTSQMVGNNEYLYNQLKGWNCIDFSEFKNITIGGFYNLNSDKINYLKGRAFYCHWNYTTNVYYNCTDYNAINNLLNAKTKMYFSLNIPALNVQAANIYQPIQTDLTNVFGTLAPLLMKTDRYFYRAVNVNQELGWFFSQLQSFTGYDLIRRDQDLQVRTIDDYNNPNLIKTLYTIIVYIDRNVYNYKSTFLKLQNVIANVSGVFVAFIQASAIILSYFHKKSRYDALINYLYDFKVEKQNNLNFKFRPRNEFQKRIIQTSVNPGSDKVGSFIDQQVINSLKNVQNNRISIASNVLNSENRNSIFSSTKRKKIVKLLTKDIDFVKSKSSIDQSNILNSLIFSVSIFLLLKSVCCINKLNRKQEISISLFNLSCKMINLKTDVVYYLKFINQFEKFKSLILDQRQCEALNYLTKDVLDYTINYEKLEDKEINHIVHYFREKGALNNLTEIDKKIIRGLDQKLVTAMELEKF